MAVLVVNGRRQPEAPASAAELLREAPRGAYTAALALPGGGVRPTAPACSTAPCARRRHWAPCSQQVPGWDRHCARLAESLQLLSADAAQPLPAFQKWCQPGHAAELPRLLGEHVQPSLRAAAGACGGGAGGAVLVVLVCEGAGHAHAPASAQLLGACALL